METVRPQLIPPPHFTLNDPALLETFVSLEEERSRTLQTKLQNCAVSQEWPNMAGLGTNGERRTHSSNLSTTLLPAVPSQMSECTSVCLSKSDQERPAPVPKSATASLGLSSSANFNGHDPNSFLVGIEHNLISVESGFGDWQMDFSSSHRLLDSVGMFRPINCRSGGLLPLRLFESSMR